MGKTFGVRYSLHSVGRLEVEVEVNNLDNLYEEIDRAISRSIVIPPGLELRVGHIRQISEPWVTGDWFDLHGPGDVLCCHASIGNAFQPGDRALLESRLTELGLRVVDRWNGEPADTVSYRISNRDGTKMLTDEQKAHLCAPRPKPV